MKIIKLLHLPIFLFFAQLSKAQITIDLPVNNSVFQRNNSDQANLYIAGSFTYGAASSVQAQLRRVSDTGVQIPWTIIDAAPTKGMYFGTLVNVPAGWYTLEVRIMKTGVVLGSATQSRVGIGDVFLISGQSNSIGIWSVTGLSGSDGVITHHEYQGCTHHVPSFPTLQTITNSIQNLGMTGESSWAYGKLGTDLKAQTGFPVAFFNGGASGTSMFNWVQSQSGTETQHGLGFTYCNGENPPGKPAPYYIFTEPLHYYSNIYGIRSILWHQGETDTYLNTSQANYYNQLNTHINNVRNEFNKPNLSWVVSRVSYNQGVTSSSIINAQNNVITNGTYVYPGPVTDGIVGSSKRVDNLHFHDSGLSDLANQWLYYLNPSFFSSSAPVSAAATPKITLSISGGNVSMAAPAGYSSYKWVQGNNYTDSQVSTNQNYSSSANANFRCYVKDVHGNVNFTQTVNPYNILQQQSLPDSCSNFIYLSDYVPYSVQNENGKGPIAYDKSVGGTGDNDGVSLSLNGTAFTKGLGVHSHSEIVYKLPSSGLYKTFSAFVGIDDEIPENATGGKVIFKVFLDNNASPSYTSPLLGPADAAQNICVDLGSATQLRLVVENGGDGTANDHANWAEARLNCTSATLAKPYITSTRPFVNSGKSVYISSSINCSPNQLLWSNGANTQYIMPTLTDTSSFYVNCVNGACFGPQSNVVTVDVIPDCSEKLNLYSTKHNIDFGSATYYFNASKEIEASNNIYSPTKAYYRAGKDITLGPGFEIEPGTVFLATIEDCAASPFNWQNASINGATGSASLQGSLLSISSNGSLGGTQDSLRYFYISQTGDVTIIARIDSMSSNEFERAGIMLRSSINPGSAFHLFAMDGSGNVIRRQRKTEGMNSMFTGYTSCPSSGSWIKVEKIGNSIHTFYKTNDMASWTSFGTSTIPEDVNLNSNFLVGFAAYQNASAVFSNISINGLSN